MTNKLKYFIANWKMYGDLKSIKSLNRVIKFTKSFKNASFKMVYCPPFTLINPLSVKLKKTKISIGAQNCHQNSEYGAFTGSINAKMIKNLGAKFVILGHSENRTGGETDDIINKKIISAIKENLIVIFCIGETFSQKRKKQTFNVLRKQILTCLKGIKKNAKVIIAYEPVWSIGTGNVPTNLDIDTNINFIKKTLKKNIKFKNPKVLYGGSVNPKNIRVINKIKSLDGYLIGGASQSEKKLIDIVKKTYN